VVASVAATAEGTGASEAPAIRGGGGGVGAALREEIRRRSRLQANRHGSGEWAISERESEARLRLVRAVVVTGVLHTEALCRAIPHPFGITSEEIEEQVARGPERQEILTRDEADRVGAVIQDELCCW